MHMHPDKTKIVNDNIAEYWSNRNETDWQDAIGSHKYWWICKLGHQWQSTRKSVTNCPYCNNRKVLAGFNDLATKYPMVAKRWASKLNMGLTPKRVLFGTKRKVWWVCEKGHEYLKSISAEVANSSCPYCSGQKVLSGFNDLATKYPFLLSYWDVDKNTVSPNEVTAKSRHLAVWKCPTCAYAWEKTIISVTQYKDRYSDGEICSECRERCKSAYQSVKRVPKKLSRLVDVKGVRKSSDEVYIGVGEFTITGGTTMVSKPVAWTCPEGHSWSRSIREQLKHNNCPECSRIKNSLGECFPKLLTEWNYAKNKGIDPMRVSYSSAQRVWWVCEKRHEWETYAYQRTGNHGTQCPICSLSGYSRGEKDVLSFIKSLLPSEQVLSNVRNIIPPYELDIYVPGKKIAIEYNGLFWHDEKHLPNHLYHKNKWQLATDKGLQLLQIWESTWLDNQDLVKKMLAYKLGVSTEKRIFARKTMVRELTSTEARVFLDKYHIQGYATGSHYVGLTEKDGVLVSVMVLKKVNDSMLLNIVRYATSESVVGGFTKILAYVERVYNPTGLVTFSDHMVSDGGLYSKNGFVVDKMIRPDYMYVVHGELKHKFGYRLKRFKNDPALLYVEGMSESQLARLNSIPRIWDAGKTKWIKRLR